MKRERKFKFFGERLIKTGIAVFIAAAVCDFFGWNVVFAAIIAIVTIEPTVSDSIKKGIIRFPASIIGAGLAMLYLYLFGHGAITYSLLAVSTLFICSKLKLEAGTLIATITALAMIPGTEDQFLFTFIERVGTTSTGLVVSTLVNFTILPARYVDEIKKRNKQLFLKTADLLYELSEDMKTGHVNKREFKRVHRELTEELRESFQLCQHQRKEWKLRRCQKREVRFYFIEYKKLEKLQAIHDQLANLLTFKKVKEDLPGNKRETLAAATQGMADLLSSDRLVPKEDYAAAIEKIRNRLRESVIQTHDLSDEAKICFVVLSIHDMITELEKMENKVLRNNRMTLRLSENDKHEVMSDG